MRDAALRETMRALAAAKGEDSFRHPTKADPEMPEWRWIATQSMESTCVYDGPAKVSTGLEIARDDEPGGVAHVTGHTDDNCLKIVIAHRSD